MFRIYTDGACLGNPGPASFAFVVVDEDDNEIFTGSNIISADSTNNIGELVAVLCALKYICRNNLSQCQIFSDSQYVVKGINEWMHNWIAHNWKNSSGQRIANFQTWYFIYEEWKQIIKDKNVTIRHIPGHSGNRWNEYVDGIAKHELKRYKDEHNKK
jgi:ribonuclease HI